MPRSRPPPCAGLWRLPHGRRCPRMEGASVCLIFRLPEPAKAKKVNLNANCLALSNSTPILQRRVVVRFFPWFPWRRGPHRGKQQAVEPSEIAGNCVLFANRFDPVNGRALAFVGNEAKAPPFASVRRGEVTSRLFPAMGPPVARIHAEMQPMPCIAVIPAQLTGSHARPTQCSAVDFVPRGPQAPSRGR
jgi:hypothetical protein